MTRAEEIARKRIKELTTPKLLIIWKTTTENNDPHISIVRGWMMDEIRQRYPEAYDKWLDDEGEDEDLRKYIAMEEIA